MGRWFGTDGIRGVANRDLTPELIYRLGRAHGATLAGRAERPLVAVGRDTRLSGSMLEAAYTAGLCASGVDVRPLGVVPTPGVAWLVPHLRAQGGAVLSASHNPARDNGIKLLNQGGFKLSDPEEAELERLMEGAEELARPEGDRVGRVLEGGEDPREAWLSHLISCAPSPLEGLSIVLDCAHGAASWLGPRLFEALGARVTTLFAEPDGLNINRGCGSTHMEALCAAVVAEGADLGLAFDGDADRCLACDERGQVVDGDPTLLLFARWLKEQGRLAADTVVTTVMANFGLEEALAGLGISMVRTAVGDRHVLAELQARGAVLGGEQSGHILLLEHNTTGDGLLTGAILAGLVRASGDPLSALAGGMVRRPQLIVNVPAPDKSRLQRDPGLAEAIRRGEQRLAGRGRVLVRPSGTEPLVRLMAEGPDPEELRELLAELGQVLEAGLAAG